MKMDEYSCENHEGGSREYYVAWRRQIAAEHVSIKIRKVSNGTGGGWGIGINYTENQREDTFKDQGSDNRGEGFRSTRRFCILSNTSKELIHRWSLYYSSYFLDLCVLVCLKYSIIEKLGSLEALGPYPHTAAVGWSGVRASFFSCYTDFPADGP